jgi:hypothetical protein
MIKIAKDCTTCVYEENKHMCQRYCKLCAYHEFKCDYCKYKLIDKERFCEMENDDGSQNCCGDHFKFNNLIYEVNG